MIILQNRSISLGIQLSRKASEKAQRLRNVTMLLLVHSNWQFLKGRDNLSKPTDSLIRLKFQLRPERILRELTTVHVNSCPSDFHYDPV